MQSIIPRVYPATGLGVYPATGLGVYPVADLGAFYSLRSLTQGCLSR